MPDQTQQEQFAAFQAWQTQQAATPPTDIDVPLTIAEVLHGIVNVIGLATEGVQNAYHQAIDDWHELQNAVKEAGNQPTAVQYDTGAENVSETATVLDAPRTWNPLSTS